MTHRNYTPMITGVMSLQIKLLEGFDSHQPCHHTIRNRDLSEVIQNCSVTENFRGIQRFVLCLLDCDPSSFQKGKTEPFHCPSKTSEISEFHSVIDYRIKISLGCVIHAYHLSGIGGEFGEFPVREQCGCYDV